MNQAEELKKVAEGWMENIWRKRDLTRFDEIHSPHFVDRSSAGRRATRGAFKKGILELYEAFPDWQAMTDDLVVDPTTNKVAIRWTATGRHRAAFMGIAPTNKRITFTGIEIVRVAGGQIVERWGEWNGIELLQQLGAY